MYFREKLTERLLAYQEKHEESDEEESCHGDSVTVKTEPSESSYAECKPKSRALVWGKKGLVSDNFLGLPWMRGLSTEKWNRMVDVSLGAARLRQTGPRSRKRLSSVVTDCPLPAPVDSPRALPVFMEGGQEVPMNGIFNGFHDSGDSDEVGGELSVFPSTLNGLRPESMVPSTFNSLLHRGSAAVSQGLPTAQQPTVDEHRSESRLTPLEANEATPAMDIETKSNDGEAAPPPARIKAKRGRGAKKSRKRMNVNWENVLESQVRASTICLKGNGWPGHGRVVQRNIL